MLLYNRMKTGNGSDQCVSCNKILEFRVLLFVIVSFHFFIIFCLHSHTRTSEVFSFYGAKLKEGQCISLDVFSVECFFFSRFSSAYCFLSFVFGWCTFGYTGYDTQTTEIVIDQSLQSWYALEGFEPQLENQ